MLPVSRSRLVLCLLLATAPGLPFPARAEAPPPLAEIVHRAATRDDALRAGRMGMKCDQVVKLERLDSDGKVTSSTTERTVHFQTADITFNADVGAQGAGGAEVAKKQSEHVEASMTLSKLEGRFQMARAEDATVRDRPCYVVRYWPKAGQSSATREDKVLNNLKGRFWIAKDDFSILQSEGTLSSPVTVALIASVNRLDFLYHAHALPSGETAPGEASVNIAVKAPFYDFREKKTTMQENWRR